MPDADPHDDERWLVIGGRRWRRTDPGLPDEIVEALKHHLGRARSAVGVAKRAGDAVAEKDARRRVGLAKTGLGERGARWWETPLADRVEQARDRLAQLEDLEASQKPPDDTGPHE